MSASISDAQNRGNLLSCRSSQWFSRKSRCGQAFRACGSMLMCSKNTMMLKVARVPTFSGCAAVSKNSLILPWHGVKFTAFSPRSIALNGMERSVSPCGTGWLTNSPRPAVPVLISSFGDTKPPSEVTHSASSKAQAQGGQSTIKSHRSMADSQQPAMPLA